MSDEIDLEVSEDGTLRGMYSEQLVTMIQAMGGKIVNIGRASVVEWDKNRKGWTVCSAKDLSLCMRVGVNGQAALSRDGEVIVFDRREDALKLERQFFWQLLG